MNYKWRQEYDWLQDGKLADVLARLEISACVMDIDMEGMERYKNKRMDMMGKVGMDV